MNDVIVKETDFDVVAPIWRTHLWPGRKSVIEPTSAIRLGGGYDPLLSQQKPIFFKLQDQDERTLGVISGFFTHPGYFRSRGLFVFEEFRGRGYSRLLLGRLAAHAVSRDCHSLWSIPRRSAWGAYRQFGFELISDWFEEGMEFGPNAYAVADLPQAGLGFERDSTSGSGPGDPRFTLK